MPRKKSRAPGLHKRGDVHYWVAARASMKAKGYPIKTIRLRPGTADELAAQCRAHTDDLKRWLAERSTGPEYDGTLRSLIDCYRGDTDSPYHRVKQNTRKDYDDSLDVLRATVGKAIVPALTGRDFTRWHRALKAPRIEGGRELVRRAQGCMKLLRIIAGYGTSMRYDGCRDMRDVLSEMRFEAPAQRTEALSYGHAEAIVDLALEDGLRSIALAQALQFETTLRQKDVIGEWIDGGQDSGIVSHGHRWANGLLWSDLDGTILRKRTSKTKALAEFDLSLYPLAMKVLAHFAPEERIGPMVVCETTGRPYRSNHFGRIWRVLADRAGVPRTVWNMDSRAGGLSEGGSAGADMDDLRRHATHSTAQMTARYTRENLQATERVAKLRVASRKKE